ncbi:MAG: ATP-dependent Zn protease [Leptolyngbyaceae cyanobacterium SM1_1_3]|nr:ATP-dependent Zn protease [Leptolyngbyaceae cyanobacterium SM1_1_3]NJN01843.1 ATP-dependent Zn protease [Leptolyngbyaceae cyanobacterium RM1_1_2]NJO10304.1 ATP-dependent Zn protease [Leptolyngbyaceae cyanobacterium SL_1_1]
MRQTTLNLIAVSIFTVTMASLLGPLLQVSPLIPAVVTVGLLGIVTFDQLGLGGRLGAIAVDGLERTSSAYRERILHHEAGHFLIAHLLQIPVVDYTLSPWETWRRGLPGLGGVVFDTQSLEQALSQGQISAQSLNQFCLVWMAGIAAEQVIYGSAIGGDDDRQKLRSVCMNLQLAPSQSAMRERWALLQAKTLIQQHQAAYSALTQAMTERQPVTVCRQLLQEQCELV